MNVFCLVARIILSFENSSQAILVNSEFCRFGTAKTLILSEFVSQSLVQRRVMIGFVCF